MKKIEQMTLKEKLGQLIIAGFSGYEYNEHLKTLIEDYKVASGWKTYADQFRAIEDYPDITG